MSKRPLPPEDTTLADHAAALLGLHLFSEEPARGAAPTDEELALLSGGRLAAESGHERYQEVLSHLNANHELMARWLEVSEVQNEILPDPKAKKPGLLDWLLDFRVAALAGTAAVAVLAVSIVLRAPVEEPLVPQAAPPPPSFASAERAGMEDAISDTVVQLNISRGVQVALELLPEKDRALLLGGSEASSELKAEPEADSVPDHPVAYQYGKQLTQARLECARGPTLSAEAIQQLSELQTALNLDPATDCEAVNRMWREAIR